MYSYNYDPKIQYQSGRIRLRLIFLSTLLIGILGIVAVKKGYPWVLTKIQAHQNESTANSASLIIETPEPTAKVEAAVQTEKPLPASVTLKVPYTIQAPGGNWNDNTGYGYACEEAALLMNHYYLQGTGFPNKKIPAATAKKELDKMIAYQQKNYGYSRGEKKSDLSMKRLGQFANDYYGYDYRIIDLDEASIRREMAKGNVVIAPAMTGILRDQGGGHFSGGNVYHVITLVGYNSKGVVTNDAGFTPGHNWFYKWKVLFNSADGQKVNSPKRQGLVLSKPV